MSVSRQKALTELIEEAKRSGISIHTDSEAEELLDWAARRDGAPPESYQAVAFGKDIFVRPQYANDVRVLREEMIHVEQQRAGIATNQILTAEIQTRLLMIANRRQWALSNDEVREMIGEIRLLRLRGRY
jgi:hypothetical protein